MADLNLKKLVDKDILKLVLSLFKDNLEAGVSGKGYLNTTQVQALIDAGNFQSESQVATTVSTEIAKVVGGAPEAFDTLKEIADWIEGHPDIYNTLVAEINKKVDKTELTTTLADYVTETALEAKDYVDSTSLNTTLADYVTKVELNALEMTEAEARAIVNAVFAPEEEEIGV